MTIEPMGSGPQGNKGKGKMLLSALEYCGKGWSVIPVGKNKKPLIDWKDYQSRRASPEEIQKWFEIYPDANIGVVTGKISGITVVDCDTAEAQSGLKERAGSGFNGPYVTTGRGTQYYFAYNQEAPTRNAYQEALDIKNDGGYVIAPPSVHSSGKEYSWVIKATSNLPTLPAFYLNKAQPKPVLQAADGDAFSEGHRHDTLLKSLKCAADGGMDAAMLLEVGKRIAQSCGYDEKRLSEIPKIVEWVVGNSNKRETGKRSITAEVRAWVADSDGLFQVEDICRQLGISERTERKEVSNVLSRMLGNEIERSGRRNGEFRRIVRESEAIDWMNAPTQPMDIKLPFDMHKMVNLYPGNIIIVSGEKNMGKTGYCIEFTKLNQDKYDIHYFSSEMYDAEMKIRLQLHEEINLTDWKFHAWVRTREFAHAIRRDCINVIDYLEVDAEKPYIVTNEIRSIWERLGKGIALIAMQKAPGKEFAVGGSGTTDKSRLYLTLSKNPNDHGGIVRISSAKSWSGSESPNGKCMPYKLINGAKFVYSGVWQDQASWDAVSKPQQQRYGNYNNNNFKKLY